MKRLLTGLLALVMVFAMLPLQALAETTPEETAAVEETTAEETVAEETVTEETAAAEETEAAEETTAETEPDGTVPEETVPETIPEMVVTDTVSAESALSIGENQYGDITFTTFEDLKELASRTYSESQSFAYVGSEPLVIKEDLVLPADVYVWMGSQVTVPAGVTLTAIDWASLEVGTLLVEGTVESAYLRVHDALTISDTGSVRDGSLAFVDGAVLSGGDRISFSESWYKIYWEYEIASLAELKAAIAEANTSTDSRVAFGLRMNFQDILVDESLTIPANCEMDLSGGKLTVAAGCTLELYGFAYVSGPLVVNGALVNNSALMVIYDYNGSVTLGENGSYDGSGIFDVYTETLPDPWAALPGMNPSDFSVRENTQYSRYFELQYTVGRTKLAPPTDLEWGFDHEYWVWNEDTQQYEKTTRAMPGFISWKTALPDQARARINVYREGETTPYSSVSWWFLETEEPTWRSIGSFCMDDPESGTYYFTVTSEGDGITYTDSETATSDTWTYIKPDAQVDTPRNLTWNWPVITWDAPENAANVGGYEVQFYFAASENMTPRQVGTSLHYNEWLNTDISDSSIQENGAGYYYAKVRALSDDITVACNGEWSELSEPYNLTELTERVETRLEDLVTGGSEMEKDAIRTEVQNMDTEELRSAMLADQNDTGAVANLARLEEIAGVSTDIEVTEDASAFREGQVSMVGAGLNTAVVSDEPIKLVIDKPAKENVIPDAYVNSVAVSFSMDLENVEDSENLEVPVKITLPVPATINPQFLVILHYHANGDVEEIRPYIYQENGQYYAAFVLTSFSDFVMTQRFNGDFTGDDAVTEDDAVYLLWHTLFPQMYPLGDKAADFDGDGNVTDADAVRLLWYALFPNEYALMK